MEPNNEQSPLPGGDYSLSDSCIQVSIQEERLGGEEESRYSSGIDGHHSPESSPIAEILCDDATHQDTQSHTNVPRDENGRISRSSLVVLCHVDGHILESRPHMTVAQADEQGGTIVPHSSEQRRMKREV